MDTEVKSAIDQFQSTWTEFQKTNNEAIAAGKAKSAEFEEKIAKLNTELDKKSDEIKALQTSLRRAPKGETKELSQEQVEHKAAFDKYLRKGVEFDKSLEVKALSVNDDTSGGFMVHADMNGRIVQRIFETSPIRQYAAVTTISTDALEGPTDSDEANTGWVGEQGTRSETTTPKLKMWRIEVHEEYAQPAITQKMLDDAVWNAEAWLSNKVADKFARTENDAFVNGSGTGKPKGFLSETIAADSGLGGTHINVATLGYIPTGKAGDFVDVPSAGSDPAQGDVLITTMQSLKSAYRERHGTAWAMHRTTVGRVRRLRDNHGQYLWMPGLGVAPSTLLGFPIAEFNDMPQIAANAYAIAFGNWAEAYQIVDRVGIRVIRDNLTSKPNVLFYSTKRVGGRTINHEALKLIKFAAS